MNIHLVKTLPTLLLAATIALCGCGGEAPQSAVRQETSAPAEVIAAGTHQELKTFFANYGYDWNTLSEGVPPLILASLPGDLDRIPRITEKKRVFFLSLLPMVLMANEEISRQREELLGLLERHDAGDRLSPDERDLLASLSREYEVEEDPLSARGREMLLRRIDIVPPSMALAQAATESAYGTSRFARKGNNLFGEWTFTPGTGLVPKERPDGATYEVRRFGTLYDSVRSYMRNLNTHQAYLALRKQRQHLRDAGQPLRGADLARGLVQYSTRGEAYVEDVRAIIRRNHLSLLADISLRGVQTSPEVVESGPSGAGLLASLSPSSRRATRRIDP